LVADEHHLLVQHSFLPVLLCVRLLFSVVIAWWYMMYGASCSATDQGGGCLPLFCFAMLAGRSARWPVSLYLLALSCVVVAWEGVSAVDKDISSTAWR
jgi:hypothetical protein